MEYKLNPYKIIFKYNNSEKKRQHLIYIFVGSFGLEIKDLLTKIENLTFMDIITKCTENEINKLVLNYGDQWYKIFFNINYLCKVVITIQEDKKIKKIISDKMGVKWVETFMNTIMDMVYFSTNKYSYSKLIYEKTRTKMGKSFRISDEDYDIYKIEQEGGYEEYNDDDDDDEDTNEEIEDEKSENENITELYMNNIDKNVQKTTNDINKILNNKISLNKKDNMTIFPTYKNNNIEHDNLDTIYKKIFIFEEFIYNDDTIQTIKNKITKTILNNEIFGNINYIISSRMYLWSNYMIDSKIEQVAIGHLYKNNNEVLDVNVEPLNITNYENLEGNIKKLYNLFKNNSSKITFENLENNILEDYDNYITNNEIFMVDIYNELGKNYSATTDKINNIVETYLKIYFPFLFLNDMNQIIRYLNNEESEENIKITEIFESIYNDLTIETQITDFVETVKIKEFKNYKKLLVGNQLITQSNLYVNLTIDYLNMEKTKNELPTIDLLSVFNDFEVDNETPLIQYNVVGKNNVIAYYEDFITEFTKKENNVEILKKWIEISPYGLSFKCKVSEDKFMNVMISDIGKLEYKIIWSEKDDKNLEDIKKLHEIIIKLINKINKKLILHPIKTTIREPKIWELFYVFINGFQRFKLPNNEIIDHNEMQRICKLLYPYIFLISSVLKNTRDEIITTEKYGTYMQYKRISKYDNNLKMEKRILMSLKNMYYEEDVLIEELELTFNITKEQALQEIKKVKQQYETYINTSKKLLKPSKFKYSGVRIDIQGREIDKYLFKINGASDEKQLNKINNFINILIFIYYESYVLKNKKYIETLNIFERLMSIAIKRKLVVDVKEVKQKKSLKSIKDKDRQRISYKPIDGYSHWSRLCQNSGKNNKRRPQLYTENDIDKLLKNGYVFNKSTQEYEKKINAKNGDLAEDITLSTIKLLSEDDKEIYYACDPKENNKNMYIGFLTKGNNPLGLCMPCCFKKNKMLNMGVKHSEFYKSCKSKNVGDILKIQSGDVNYILHDTNKLTEKRLCRLPKLLNNFMNEQIKAKKTMKSYNLMATDEYYFKYGVNQLNYSFLNSLSIILNMTNLEIVQHIKNFFSKNENLIHYLSLNSGEIANTYRIGDFLDLLTDSIDYYYLKDILKIKGLFTKNGIMPLVFNYMNNKNEKNDFYIDIDKEVINNFDYWKLQFHSMDILIFIKDIIYYYPIVKTIKNKSTKHQIEIEKFVKNKIITNNILEYLTNQYSDMKLNYSWNTSFNTYQIINDMIKQNPSMEDYTQLHQIIDNSYKCIYIVCKNNCIIPVEPSAIIPNLNIMCFRNNKGCSKNIEKIDCEEMTKKLEKLYDTLIIKLPILPSKFIYTKLDDIITIVGIETTNNSIIPIKEYTIDKKELKNEKYKQQPLDYIIDENIINDDKYNYIDDKMIYMKKYNYINEGYNVFRFEFSNLINLKEFEIEKKILEENIQKKDKEKIALHIKKILEKDDYLQFTDKIVNISSNNNKRVACINLDKNKCSTSYCTYDDKDKKCKMTVYSPEYEKYILNMTNELVLKSVKYMEIMHIKKYYVQDIINYKFFDLIHGKKIINNVNIHFDDIFESIFNKNLPILNRKKNKMFNKKNNKNNEPLKELKNMFIQNVNEQSYSIIRAYSNCFYWITHPLYDNTIKNLGFMSETQTELVNLFISQIIDWLNIESNILFLLHLSNLEKEILQNSICNILNYNEKQFIINEYIVKIINNNTYIFEIFVLSIIHEMNVVILLNNEQKYYISKGSIAECEDISVLNKNNICINITMINNIKYFNSIYYK